MPTGPGGGGTAGQGGVGLQGGEGGGGQGGGGSPPVDGRVGAGWNHSCAVKMNGSLRCWGRGDFGQLGNGLKATSTTPVAVSGLATAASASGGVLHTCALEVDGTASCWGRNAQGQIGNASFGDVATPAAVVNLSGVAEVASGTSHNCARLGNGQVWCWGEGSLGELGNGVFLDSATPVQANVSNATSIGAGHDHTCAVLSSGAVHCWGDNNVGELGRGTIGAGPVAPGAVVGISDAVEVDASFSLSCARHQNNTVSCWGYNSSGQLGADIPPTTAYSASPVAVMGLGNVEEIALGQLHACARRMDGTVACWGDNSEGQLGNNDQPNDSQVPVDVTGLNGVVSIDAGQFHTCAYLDDDSARCWGRNVEGQLGNGTMTGSAVPVAVSGL